MSITIKENPAPKLNMPVMLCDGDIAKKLDKYDLTKFLNMHSTNLLIGRPKSGKTSLLVSLFTNKELLRNCFHNIFLVIPDASLQSLKNNVFSNLPPEQVFNDLNVESLTSILNFVINEPKDFNNVIIIDDMAAKLKDKPILNLLRELVNNRRHLRLSIYFLSQTYMAVPSEVRKLFSNLFIFKTNKRELETIFDEQFESNIKYMPQISKMVYDKPFQYLFMNTDSQRFFKGFDELILPD